MRGPGRRKHRLAKPARFRERERASLEEFARHHRNQAQKFLDAAEALGDAEELQASHAPLEVVRRKLSTIGDAETHQGLTPAEQLEAFRQYSEWYATQPRRDTFYERAAMMLVGDPEGDAVARAMTDNELVAAIFNNPGDPGHWPALLDSLEKRTPKYTEQQLAQFKKEREEKAAEHARQEARRMQFRSA